jgi:hypothetical protein
LVDSSPGPRHPFSIISSKTLYKNNTLSVTQLKRLFSLELACKMLQLSIFFARIAGAEKFRPEVLAKSHDKRKERGKINELSHKIDGKEEVPSKA